MGFLLAFHRRLVGIGVRLGRKGDGLQVGTGRLARIAEQGVEQAARPRRRRAFGVVARDELFAPAVRPAGARLQFAEIGLHLRKLRVDLLALRGRIAAEEQELMVLAADRPRVDGGPLDLAALLLRRRLELRVRPGAAAGDRDRLLKARAIDALRLGRIDCGQAGEDDRAQSNDRSHQFP